MIRVAITENEAPVRKRIRELLNRFCKEQNCEFDISEYTNGRELTDVFRPVFDVIFMDIDMPQMNGLAAAGRIREVDQQVIIIFITDLAQYALQGYRVQAYDYIVKPVDYTALSFTLQKVLRILRNRPDDKSLLISFDGSTTRVPISEITYIEVTGHKLYCHTADELYPLYSSTLAALEEELSSFHFVRCNNCYLVNLAQVKSVLKTSVIVGKEELSISRPRRKDFLTALTNFIESM